MKLNKMLKSNVLYYVALALMVVNILGYVSVGSVECVIVFAVSTYLANMYTKNRSLDILVGLFVSNIVFACGRVKEGMKGGVEKVMEELLICTQKQKRKVIKKKAKNAAKVAKLADECKEGDKDCKKNIKTKANIYRLLFYINYI